MAQLQAAALLARVRELLTRELGSRRVIPAERFNADNHAGLTEAELVRRGLAGGDTSAEVPLQVRLRELSKHPASPPIESSLVIYELRFDVVVTRTVATEDQLSPGGYEAVQAAALQDADVIRQVLTTPGNLAVTSNQADPASTATDVAGAALFRRSTYRDIGRADKAQRLEATHEFTVVLKSRPATT